MPPQEFKDWIDNCIRDAKKKGFTDEDILFEFMERVRIMVTKRMIEIMK
jgi:hypothetical protein